MTTHKLKFSTASLLGLIAFFVDGQVSVRAQDTAATQSAGAQIIEPGEDVQTAEFVTINVKDANIAEVLKAYSLQTGQSIVVGPDVVSENVNVRLNNIPWEDALDVILKPYGFGYRVVGDTIVISKLENIVTVEGIEPLVSKVFNLSFVDAYDIKSIIEAQLTVRGKFTIHETKSLPGWEFGGEGNSGAAVEAGVRSRKKKEEIQKSKTFVITDVPSAITKIENILEQLDLMPEQVLIEAKFLEISTGGLSDIGLEYIGALEQVTDSGLGAGNLTPALLDEDLLKVLNLTTGFPDPMNTKAAGGYSQDSGINLSHSVVGDWGAQMLFNFIEQDDDANVLSAPRVMTMNNQEAAILVGQKYPIIKSENNSGSGSTVTSTSLDYYENEGIQLNVIPQVCANDYVNMIVHPAVSEFTGDSVAGVVTAGSSSQSGTSYPVIRIREAETQVMIKSASTAIIGGLQNERDTEIIKKIPFLGDIPFLGRLFRSERIEKEKIDLLIFIKATVVDNEAYAADSLSRQQTREARMDLELTRKAEIEEQAAIEVDAKTAKADQAENEEILALVQQMDGGEQTKTTETSEEGM